VRNGEVNDLVGDYGHLIVDECHHLSAVSFELVARRSNARHVLGLSATIARKDGHHPIIFMQCGPVRYRVDAKSQAATRPFNHKVTIRETGFRLAPDRESQSLMQITAIYAALAKDEKRTKLVARQMMRMVEEINRRVDTLPHDHDQPHDSLRVTCMTCHRGVSRPVPLEQLIAQTAQTSGADSAARAYRALRERYYGRAAYDFGEPTLDIAAFRLGRAGKYDEAFAILKLNEEQFPNSSNAATFRGNINLMKGDTTAAIASFREAVKRDSTNGEAQGRLRALTRSSP